MTARLLLVDDAAVLGGLSTALRDPADTSRRWGLEGAVYLHERAP